jgi:DNA-binding MarR family transcriptional regulator
VNRQRVRNPDDRRSYSLTRTTAGRDPVRRWAPHVDGLERCGLVTRERDPADHRVYRLHLTADAERVVEEATTISVHVLADRFGAGDSPGRKDLVRLSSSAPGGFQSMTSLPAAAGFVQSGPAR